MKVAVISANLGNFDPVVENVEQSLPPNVEMRSARYTDKNFPPRHHAMQPRLQARIPKMFGWQLMPDFDYYIWVDSSCSLLHPGSVEWFLDCCRGFDFAVFKHPDRPCIYAEYTFLREKITQGSLYLKSRYDGEFLDEQMSAILDDPFYVDSRLFASTAFIYHNNKKVRDTLKEWWYHTSRFHSIDQLSLPYVLWQFECLVNVIEENYLNTPYLTYVRNRK